MTVKTLKAGQQGHQGDVHFKKLNKIGLEMAKELLKAEKEQPEDGVLTMVEGEGHHLHAFKEPNKVDAFRVFKDEAEQTGVAKIFITLIKGTTELQHIKTKTKELSKEHNTIEHSPGAWIFNSQRNTNLERKIFPVVD